MKYLRKSFEVNFFSHQNCARRKLVKIMKKQNINGCLLFNISKQSVNPGKNFGPYGLPKSALLSLCKQYAVDYGSYGIRSNGINADRIRSGLMTDKMIRTRAKARSVSTDNYMKGNLLLNEVKAEDVAKAFFHLATSKKNYWCSSYCRWWQYSCFFKIDYLNNFFRPSLEASQIPFSVINPVTYLAGVTSKAKFIVLLFLG